MYWSIFEFIIHLDIHHNNICNKHNYVKHQNNVLQILLQAFTNSSVPSNMNHPM
jgi:hypothetical protein